MKAIGKNDFIADVGEEITFTEDMIVLFMEPYDPNHVGIRTFETKEEMDKWLEKEFTNLDYEVEPMFRDFVFKVTELNV